VDRFVTRGSPAEPPVFETAIGRIGLAICYDLRFPESARTLALSGADIIAQPSNWPPQAWMLADHFTVVRACENRVFLLVANRWDVEKGVPFMGQSQIVSPTGHVLSRAGTTQTLISAVIDVDLARDKRIVVEPGVYEVSLFTDRRPDLYGPITTATSAAHAVV
jgi:predicted amidohydrolase